MNKESRIKVLYITSAAHLYGDNRSLLNSLKVLKECIDILVCVTQKGLFTEELDRQGIRYVQIAGTMAPQNFPIQLSYKWLHRLFGLPRRTFATLKTRKQLNKIIQDYHPNIIHSNNGFIYAGAKMAKRFNIPHVWHLREYIELDHHRTIPDKSFFETERRRSHCIAITHDVFNYWQLQEPKDTQIYNGVYQENEVPPYQPHKQKEFLFLGRIIPTKGLDDLIEGFARFIHSNPELQDYNLNIVGDGIPSYITHLRDTAQKLGVGANVHFLGFHADVRPMLLVAKALIVPSPFEAMGRITAEAMLTGCFVIGRNTGGTRELLTLENAGLTFEQVEGLAAALAQVANYTDEELANLNMAVRQRALRHFTAEVNAQSLLRYYQQILP